MRNQWQGQRELRAALRQIDGAELSRVLLNNTVACC